MRRYRLEEMKRGWFMGDFDPSILRTDLFEVGYKHHHAGEGWPAHFQRIAVEYNVLIQGRMAIGEDTFNDGDIFVIPPGEVVKPIFLSDCELIVVKVPSLPEDKVVVE